MKTKLNNFLNFSQTENTTIGNLDGLTKDLLGYIKHQTNNLNPNHILKSDQDLMTLFCKIRAPLSEEQLSALVEVITVIQELKIILQIVETYNQLDELDLSNKKFCDIKELSSFLQKLPANIKKINLSGSKLQNLGTVQEVGDLLLKHARDIVISEDDEFSGQLKEYINKHPLIALFSSIKDCVPKSLEENSQGMKLYGLFGPTSEGAQDLPPELHEHIFSFLPRASE